MSTSGEAVVTRFDVGILSVADCHPVVALEHEPLVAVQGPSAAGGRPVYWSKLDALSISQPQHDPAPKQDNSLYSDKARFRLLDRLLMRASF